MNIFQKKTAADVKALINAEPTQEQREAATRAAKHILSNKDFRENTLEIIASGNAIDHLMTQMTFMSDNVTFYALQSIQRIQEQRGASERAAATFAYNLLLQTVTEERKNKQA